MPDGRERCIAVIIQITANVFIKKQPRSYACENYREEKRERKSARGESRRERKRDGERGGEREGERDGVMLKI